MLVEKMEAKQLHYENKVWKNELLFVADEIKVYENRLSDLVRGEPVKKMLRKLEHFQNQFIREKEVIDTLKHDVSSHEHMLVEWVKMKKGSEEMLSKKHDELKDRMETFRKIFTELKAAFYEFLAEWLN
jgi:predicted RNase H-like nuclease (RuvC/YqgF family)